MSAVAHLLLSLPDLVRGKREARGLSLRDAADEIGVSFNTLTRFEHRASDVRLTVVLALLKWIES